jgi:hypothetical protein
MATFVSLLFAFALAYAVYAIVRATPVIVDFVRSYEGAKANAVRQSEVRFCVIEHSLTEIDRNPPRRASTGRRGPKVTRRGPARRSLPAAA